MVPSVLLLLLLLSIPAAHPVPFPFPPRRDWRAILHLPPTVSHRPSSNALPRSHARSLTQAQVPDDPDLLVQGMAVPQLRTQITEHRNQLSRIQQQIKDISHQKSFMEKALELKRGQRTMQDGQVKLSQAELADKEREIAMYKREAPLTLQRYNQLVRKQRDLQHTLSRLHEQSQNILSTNQVMREKMQHLNVEDVVEHHARALPQAMAGALRKSAAALTPFFDYLSIAATTNDRLVDQFEAQIDRYTHVNVSKSPFLSGILYYCVLLIPLITLFAFMRRLMDTSSKWTVSHYIVLGNVYFILMCLINLFIAQFTKTDPMEIYYLKFERTFIAANLFLAMYYVWHVAMMSLQTALNFDRNVLAHLVATLAVGLHYFIFTWRNIFTDKPPVMYSFNYLMYATIFLFILRERFNRLSPRQIRGVPLFQLVHSRLHASTKRDTPQSQWSGIFQSLAAILKPNRPPRRFSKRHDRAVIIDRNTRHRRQQTKDRSARATAKATYSSASELDTSEEERNFPMATRKTNSAALPLQQQHIVGADQEEQGERRGLLGILFGSARTEEVHDSSSSSPTEDEDAGQTGWMRRVRAPSGRNVPREMQSLRKGYPTTRERQPARRSRSIWKWS